MQQAKDRARRPDFSPSDRRGRVFRRKDGDGRPLDTHTKSQNQSRSQKRYGKAGDAMSKQASRFIMSPGAWHRLTAPGFGETGRDGGGDEAEGGDEDYHSTTEVKVKGVGDPASTTACPRWRSVTT